MADSLSGRRKKHPGFKAVQRDIASEYGGSMEIAGRVLGKRTREASPAAKRRNPRLNRVRSKKRGY